MNFYVSPTTYCNGIPALTASRSFPSSVVYCKKNVRLAYVNERYLWHIHQPQLTWSTAYRLCLEMLTLTHSLRCPGLGRYCSFSRRTRAGKKVFSGHIYVRWKNVRESGNLWGRLANKRLFALFSVCRIRVFEFDPRFGEFQSNIFTFSMKRKGISDSATCQNICQLSWS